MNPRVLRSARSRRRRRTAVTQRVRDRRDREQRQHAREHQRRRAHALVADDVGRPLQAGHLRRRRIVLGRRPRARAARLRRARAPAAPGTDPGRSRDRARRSAARVSSAPSPSAVLSDPGYVPRPGEDDATDDAATCGPRHRRRVALARCHRCRRRRDRGSSTPSAISSSARGARPVDDRRTDVALPVRDPERGDGHTVEVRPG